MQMVGLDKGLGNPGLLWGLYRKTVRCGMRLPSLNSLRAFEVVSRSLNLREAADELSVTKAAVSQQIKQLEADLGIDLVRKTNKGLALTEAGQAALKELRDGFSQLGLAVEKMRNAGRSQLLTLSAPPTFSATWLLVRLERFKQQHPDIDVLLDARSGYVSLESGNVQAAIRYGTGSFPDLHAVKLFEEHVFPVCSPALMQGERGLRTLADLRRHTLLHLEWMSADGTFPDWAAWLRAAGVNDVDVARGLRFTSHSLVLQAAAQGQGIALASTPLADDDLAAGRLVAPFDRALTTNWGYYFVSLPEFAASHKVRAFRDWLLAEAGLPAMPGHSIAEHSVVQHGDAGHSIARHGPAGQGTVLPAAGAMASIEQ